MNRLALAAIWKKSYPEDSQAREAAVLADMMASRFPGEEAKRPSVETLLHDLLPYKYVIHTHPALVNGLTCARDGEKAVKEMFPQAFWIPLVDPGYVLSKTVKEALESEKNKDDNGRNKNQIIIFLQNHGIFAAADSTEEIDDIYRGVMGKINNRIREKPDFQGVVSNFGDSELIGKKILGFLGKAYPDKQWFIKFERSNRIITCVADEASFIPVSSAFSPDHIVYSGSDPLFIDDIALLEEKFTAHANKTRIPKILAVKSLGIFSIGNSVKSAENAMELFRDTIKISVYTGNFGGPLFMNDRMIRFINNWEVESYRTKVAEN